MPGEKIQSNRLIYVTSLILGIFSVYEMATGFARYMTCSNPKDDLKGKRQMKSGSSTLICVLLIGISRIWMIRKRKETP